MTKPLSARRAVSRRAGQAGTKNTDYADGKPRLLNVFASWCGPCVAEIPVLMKLKAMGVEINGVVTPLAKEAHRFYGNVPTTTPVTLPQTVSVTASDPGVPSNPNTKTSPLRDLVTISSAVARCSGAGVTKSCLLTVNAASSDDGSGADGAPQLTLQHNNTALTNGAVSTVSAAVPAAVTVTSTKGGVASRPVTVINQ